MGRKRTILNRCILVNTDFDGKWFVLFEHTINRLSFGYVRLPQLEYYFFLFSYFFFLFSCFFFRLSTFKPLNVLYSKLKRLIRDEKSGNEIEVARLGGSLQRRSQKFFQGGQATYPLFTGLIKTLQLQPGFC